MLYIRTDMNSTIASGHVMRCLAIAEAARDLGQDVTFITADEQPLPLIKEKGFPIIILNSVWNEMDRELPLLNELNFDKNEDHLLVDSYQVTEFYLRELNKYVDLWYIDDLNAFTYPVNGLVFYANYYKKYGIEDKYPETELLMGSSFAPLRKDYRGVAPKKIRKNVERILILSGGTDQYNVICQVLEGLNKSKIKSVDAVCGIYNPRFDQLTAQYQKDTNVHIHKHLKNLHEYIKNADLVITAGGTTLYELCACGTPAISYSIADNQLDNVSQFEEDGLIDYLGDVREQDICKNLSAIMEKYESPEFRLDCSRRMQETVDGNGAEKIVKAILKLS